MGASLITFVLLGCMLLWLLAWQRGSRMARGIAIGAILTLIAEPFLRSLAGMNHIPVWVPALPFALVALTLFVFGLLAWIWGEE